MLFEAPKKYFLPISICLLFSACSGTSNGTSSPGATPDVTPDTTAPGNPVFTAPASSASTSSASYNYQWNAATDNVAVTGYQVEVFQNATCSGAATTTITSQAGTSYSASLALGDNSLKVYARDGAGNLSTGICSGTVTRTPGCASASPGTNFSVCGTITYDWIPAVDGTGGAEQSAAKLYYPGKVAKPARRITVQAIEGASTVVAETVTKDDGTYFLDGILLGKTVKVRAVAKLYSTSATADGIAPDNCVAASWDVRAVDNTASKALYAMDTPGTYTASTDAVNLHAATTRTGSGAGTSYISRVGAPFALLDTVLSGMELVCAGVANTAFPLLYVNWSVNNSTEDGDPALGEIGTSYSTIEGGNSNLYILGEEDVDTDEYDDHVIAHELGHYLEDRIYRSDSIGGSHSGSDSLDPRVAFGEGYGNAFSGMVFSDPIYVDSYSSDENSGFTVNGAQAPTADGRGHYSERSVMYFLWKLFDNRDGTANSGSYDRIDAVMRGSQRTTAALTSVQSFGAYYRAAYGSTAESLSTLWATDLDTPLDALCVGACPGGAADPFDSDNDAGAYYAAQGRKYKQSTGTTMPAGFWRLYRTLSAGANLGSSGDSHDQTNYGGYSAASAYNKFGNVRWYRWVATSTNTTIAVGNLTGGSLCTTDVLDMHVYRQGVMVAWNEAASGATAGCPTVTFASTIGDTYVVTLTGYTNAVTGWDITVTP